jgi:16S rRNA (guanine(527)-N(7))-methyltransferase RsmG
MDKPSRSCVVSLPSHDIATFQAVLAEGAALLGFRLTDEQKAAFGVIVERLTEWNGRMNLTAVRAPGDIAVKHILDSMTCLAATPFPDGARLLDVGTGAGFPALALKVMRPDLRLAVLDSTRKKLDFVQSIADEMGWTDTRVLCGRAEELAHLPEEREAYDVVTARAVAALRLLAEFCLPFTRIGGVFLAMKGPAVAAELEPARSAIERLGGRAEDAVSFTLPFEGGARAILPIRKVAPTPPAYPRIFREIKRSPL